MTAYVDLELVLRRRPDGSLSVEARSRVPGRSDETLTADLLPIRLDEAALRAALPDWQTYGRLLTAMVFADRALRRAFTAAVSEADTRRVPLRLRFNLDVADTALHAVAWEALQHPDQPGDRFLASYQAIRLSRLPASASPAPIYLPPRATLRAVVAVAGPPGLERYSLSPIDAPAERKRVTAALGAIGARELGRGAGRPASLAAIADALGARAEIFYLVCHGTLVEGQPVLWLEDEDGSLARVPGAALVETIAQLDARPLLVVLASCRTAGDGTPEAALAAIGPQLAAGGVAAVLAMRGDVSTATAATFGAAFFKELSRDGQIDRAVAAARAQVRGQPDWLAPVLLMRVRDGGIWAPAAPRRDHSRWALVAVVVAVLALVAAVGLRAVRPAPMTGAFNIAVAPFGSLNAIGRAGRSDEGTQLAQQVFSALGTELEQLAVQPALQPALRGPDQLEPLADDGEARELAEAINADIVIYGSISADGTVFTPQIFVAGRQLADAEELAGAYPLGEPLTSPVALSGNMVVRERFGAELGRRARPIADFVAAVNYYTVKEFDRAAEAFRAAEAAWGELGHKELVYLYLGNTAGRLGGPEALAEAARAYEQAIVARPGYPRARVGLAEMTLLRAMGTCAPGSTDEAGLDRAAAELRDVLAGAAQAEEPDLALKANYTLGRALLCRAEVASYRGDAARLRADAAEARAMYREVTGAFEKGNGRMRLRAAFSYADLAYLDMVYPDDGAVNADDYRRAEAGYTTALATLTSDRVPGIPVPPSETRQEALYHARLGYIRCRLGERERAEADYGEALAIAPEDERFRELLAALRKRGACTLEE